jgi:hypothetical protein
MLTQFKESKLKKSINRIVGYPWIPILFSIGALLRISGFIVGRLWYDEVFSLEMTRQNLFEMINALKANISPPGWETILWFITRVFGWNAFSLRLISVIASIVTLWIMYKIGITLQFTRRQLIALIAVAALLPYQLISAQQGRVYALFAMFYLLGFYAALVKHWLVLGVCAAALFWCHNVSFMFVPALFFIALFAHPKNWGRIILIFFISGLTYVPWLRVTLTQAATPIPWFPPLTPYYFIMNFIYALFGFNLPIWAMIIVLIVGFALCLVTPILPLAGWIYRDMRKDIAALYANRLNIKIWIVSLAANRKKAGDSLSLRQSKWILFIAFATPLSMLILASILIQNAIIYRTIYPLTIPLIMWLVSIYVVPQPKALHITLWVLTLLMLIIGVISWAPSQPGEDFANLEFTVDLGFRMGGKYVPHAININKNELGDAFFHDTGWTALVFKYYFPNKPNYLIDENNVIGLGDVQVTKARIPQANPEEISAQRLWVVWASNDMLAKINKAAEERTHQLIIKYNCPLIDAFYYSKALDIKVYLCDFHQK